MVSTLDPALPDLPGSQALLTNLMASLSNDDTLLGIRAKGEILRPLKPGWMSSGVAAMPWMRQSLRMRC